MSWTIAKSIIVGNAFLTNEKNGKRHYVNFNHEQADRILITTIRSENPSKLSKNVVAMVEEQVKQWTGQEKKVY